MIMNTNISFRGLRAPHSARRSSGWRNKNVRSLIRFWSLCLDTWSHTVRAQHRPMAPAWSSVLLFAVAAAVSCDDEYSASATTPHTHKIWAIVVLAISIWFILFRFCVFRPDWSGANNKMKWIVCARAITFTERYFAFSLVYAINFALDLLHLSCGGYFPLNALSIRITIRHLTDRQTDERTDWPRPIGQRTKGKYAVVVWFVCMFIVHWPSLLIGAFVKQMDDGRKRNNNGNREKKTKWTERCGMAYWRHTDLIRFAFIPDSQIHSIFIVNVSAISGPLCLANYVDRRSRLLQRLLLLSHTHTHCLSIAFKRKFNCLFSVIDLLICKMCNVQPIIILIFTVGIANQQLDLL